MTTDYNIHPPHKNYVATLTIKGTKDDFVSLGLMLQRCVEDPEADLEDQKKILEILEEVDAIINYLTI